MRARPQFSGSVNDLSALARYERELREWEAEVVEERALREREMELRKAELDELIEEDEVARKLQGPPGPPGPPGENGLDGLQGPPGPGVPAGGTADQYLAKIDGTDYNTEWRTINPVKLSRIAAGVGTQSITGSATVITWAIEQIPQGGSAITFDNTNDEFNIGEDGVYMIGFSLNVDSTISTLGESRVGILATVQRNGTINLGPRAQLHEDSEFMDAQQLNLTFVEALSAGDTIRFLIEQLSGTDECVLRQIACTAWIMKLEAAGPPA